MEFLIAEFISTWCWVSNNETTDNSNSFSLLHIPLYTALLPTLKIWLHIDQENPSMLTFWMPTPLVHKQLSSVFAYVFVYFFNLKKIKYWVSKLSNEGVFLNHKLWHMQFIYCCKKILCINKICYITYMQYWKMYIINIMN